MSDSETSVSRVDVRSQDPEFAHQELRDAYTDLTVRSPITSDGFRFRHERVVAHGFSLGRVHYGASAELDAHAPPSLLVTSRVDGHMEVGRDTDSVRPEIGMPMLMPPDAGWVIAVDDVVADTISLDASAVARAAGSAFGAGRSLPTFTSMRPVSAAAARYWRGLVEHVRRDVVDDEAVAASPLVLAEATRSLATALLLTFPNSGLVRMDGPDGDRPDPAVLRRAVAFVDEHAGEDIGVEDIASAARISVRGLQALFRGKRGCSPLEYLRQVRMERAHEDLMAADPTRGDTVAVVAARWGFAHAGRFSVQYRNRFGRSPRQTLQN